jgi:nitrite reductase/ring-hydroxylating ferredoxin subunit
MTLYKVAKVDDQQPDSLTAVEVGGTEICLARLGDGTYCALEDLCTHEDIPLSEGTLMGTQVECPAHSSRFSVVDGDVQGLPAIDRAQTYRVVIEGGDVFVDID